MNLRAVTGLARHYSRPPDELSKTEMSTGSFVMVSPELPGAKASSCISALGSSLMSQYATTSASGRRMQFMAWFLSMFEQPTISILTVTGVPVLRVDF